MLFRSKTGEIVVNRAKAGGRELLLDIKQGRLPYTEVDEMVNGLFEESERVLREECVLPDRVDYSLISSLCEEVIVGKHSSLRG